jgi:LmbE family N-acetylglucosaminyl deacetylase
LSEGVDACARLGAVLETAKLPDTRMTDGFETISAISEVIRRHAPTILYTHTEHDVHQDHRHAHRASLVAGRTVPNVYCYQTPSSTTGFLPSCFVDIDAHIERKIELLSAFQSQAARPYLAPDMVRASARYWGRFSNYHNVEALEVVRAAGGAFAEQQAS